MLVQDLVGPFMQPDLNRNMCTTHLRGFVIVRGSQLLRDHLSSHEASSLQLSGCPRWRHDRASRARPETGSSDPRLGGTLIVLGRGADRDLSLVSGALSIPGDRRVAG